MFPIHDFIRKLSQSSIASDLRQYIEDVSSPVSAVGERLIDPKPLTRGPLSVNIDLTVACNHSCPHCIDESVLNSGAKLESENVVATLKTLRKVGLRSAIFIGGGEPTLHPDFEHVVHVAADLGLNVGIVSNGSRPDTLVAAAKYLHRGDWVRLSLDAGSDLVFQGTHRPRKATRLETACRLPRTIKAANECVSCGFSFVVITPESADSDCSLTVNYHLNYA